MPTSSYEKIDGCLISGVLDFTPIMPHNGGLDTEFWVTNINVCTKQSLSGILSFFECLQRIDNILFLAWSQVKMVHMIVKSN